MKQRELPLTAAKLDRPAVLQAIAKRFGDAAIAAGKAKATSIDPDFIEKACAHIVAYLEAHGTSSGEMLTDSCKLAGITSTDDRHFGAVFQALIRRGLIEWAGVCKRVKGHGSRGGSLYRLGRSTS